MKKMKKVAFFADEEMKRPIVDEIRRRITPILGV
jgi:hypothetical protein